MRFANTEILRNFEKERLIVDRNTGFNETIFMILRLSGFSRE